MTDPAENAAWTGFELVGRAFALDYRSVERVLAAAPVAPVPFAPSGIEGVANLSGEVLPVVDLARLLGLGASGTIPVTAGAQFLVIRVDHQRFMLRVERLLFVAADLAVARTEDATMPAMAGEASWHDRAVTCLAAEQLGLGGLLPRAPSAGAPGEVLDPRTTADSEQVDDATDRLALVVEAAGAPCALTAGSVLEVLEEAILNPLPLVPPEVLGVIVVRRQPLLVLSLAALQGRPSRAAHPTYVLAAIGRARLALAVDGVRGMQRLAGTDLVMLDLEAVIGSKWLALAADMATDMAAPSVVQSERLRFLGVTVGDRRCALPLAAVERILSPRQPIALPEGAPPGVDGAIEYGGHIVPVTDAARWLSAGDGGTTGAQVVLQHDGMRRVLAVTGIQRIVSLASEDILPAADQDARIAAVVRIAGGSLEILSTEALMAAGEGA